MARWPVAGRSELLTSERALLQAKVRNSIMLPIRLCGVLLIIEVTYNVKKL